MLKMLLGAAIVVGLVGYGVVTTNDIERAGDAVKNTVNAGASWVKEQTDPTIEQRIREAVQ